MAVRFGRRVRKGAAGTAVAAAAMAALTASQAPGMVTGAVHRPLAAPTPPPGPQIDGGSPYITNLPPLSSIGTPTQGGTGPVVGAAGSGIPATVLAAYRRAEASLRASEPGCRLPWQLLAAIGQVESGQAERGEVDAAGTTLRPILGPVLDGGAFADIPDTDGGRWDGDTAHDRAVGPMQFIPSTWATWGTDGNGDGIKDPNNVFDAALAAGDYLCAVGGDLAVPASMKRAILGYNHSEAYLNTVESWYEYFRKGVHEVPDNSSGAGITAPTGLPSASASPTARPSASPSRSPMPTVSASGSVGPVSGSPSAPGDPSGTPTSPGTPSAPVSTCPTDPTSPPPSDPTSPTPTPTDSTSPTPSDPSDPCASPTPTSPSPTPTRGHDPERQRHRFLTPALKTHRLVFTRRVGCAVVGSSGHGCRG